MHSFFPGKDKPQTEQVRGHEASVQFRNGFLIQKPQRIQDNIIKVEENYYLLAY